MKNIYILDEFQSAKQNGLGVFVKELANFLKEEFNVSIIYTNSDYEEFCIEEKGNITYYHIPKVPRYPFSDNAETINLFISIWIKDTIKNVFIVNHSPCTELLTSLKETHPLSKIIFVIHDLGWRSILEGDLEKYIKIIENRNEHTAAGEHTQLLEIFDNELKFYSLADKVVCLSQDTHLLLLETYKLEKNKVRLIHNGISCLPQTIDIIKKERIRKELHILSKEKILLYVGRVNKTKGGNILLKCFPVILEHYPNSRIVVIGNVTDKEAFNEIGNSVCKISFTGHLAKEDVYKWYSIANLGIVSSYAEQCSYSAMEMMAHGLPIVASDGYGVRNMFKDGENAVVAQIGNRENNDEYSNNLSSAILKVLNSESLQKKLGEANKSISQQDYTTSRMGEKYKELINLL